MNVILEAFKKLIEKIKLLFSYKKTTEETSIDFSLEFWGWMLWIWEKETDFLLGSWYLKLKKDLIKKEDLWRDIVYEYNQWAQHETRNWCTIYSVITELSYLMDRKFSLCEIQRVGHKMIKDGKLDPDYGAYLSDAVDYVRKDWNEHNPEKQIVSYRIDYKDINLIKVLDDHIPRPTQLGYRTSWELSREIRKAPYVATKVDYPKVGGHAVTRYKGEIVDNYKRTDNKNRYRFVHLPQLIDNWVVFQNGYLLLKK